MVKVVQRLITFGDSFTFGQELADPKKDCWAQLVANYLDVPLINTAFPGNSNCNIMEQIVKENYEHYDFVIVCFSSISRLYFEDQFGWFTTIPKIKEDHHFRKDITEILHKHISEEYFFRKWLTQIIYIQEFLKSRQTRYFFVKAFENFDLSLVKKKSNYSLINMIDQNMFIGGLTESFDTLTADFPRGKFLHPLEEAHEYFANMINVRLKNLYDLPKEY